MRRMLHRCMFSSVFHVSDMSHITISGVRGLSFPLAVIFDIGLFTSPYNAFRERMHMSCDVTMVAFTVAIPSWISRHENAHGWRYNALSSFDSFDEPLALGFGVACSDAIFQGVGLLLSGDHSTNIFINSPDIPELKPPCASDHFLTWTRSWRYAPVMVSPHLAKPRAEIRRCPRHERPLRLPAFMSNNGSSTYYTAGDD